MLIEYIRNNIAIEEQMRKTPDHIIDINNSILYHIIIDTDSSNIRYHIIIHISSQVMEINNKIFSKVLRLHLGKSYT